MKKTLIISLVIAIVFFAFSCSNTKAGNQNQTVTSTNTTVYYTCRMHPEVHSDKPGNCPKCGMELIKKEEAKTDSTKVVSKADTTKTK